MKFLKDLFNKLPPEIVPLLILITAYIALYLIASFGVWIFKKMFPDEEETT
jgi:hypothetical protein